MKKIVSLLGFVSLLGLIMVGCKSNENSFYKNGDYAFQIEIPEEWENKYTVLEDKDEKNENIKSQLAFLYTGDKNMKEEDRAELFRIYVLDKNYWEEIDKNKEEPPLGAYLGEKGELVYVVATPQSNPYGEETEAGKDFDKMYKLMDLDKNFKIN